MFKPIQVMLCAFMTLFIFSCGAPPVTLENGETLRPGIRADEKDKIILTRYLDHCKTEVGKIDEVKIK